jgi:hypothetical protein
MIQLQLPRPEQYSNWQDWARALLAVLQAQSVRPAIKPHAKELVDTVRTLAGDREIEGFVVNPAVLRVYKSLGFEPVGTFVRLPNGKST